MTHLHEITTIGNFVGTKDITFLQFIRSTATMLDSDRNWQKTCLTYGIIRLIDINVTEFSDNKFFDKVIAVAKIIFSQKEVNKSWVPYIWHHFDIFCIIKSGKIR